MIVPMKKVSIVVLNKERKEALIQLKKCGVVHIETLEGFGEKLAAYKENAANAISALSILGEIKLSGKKQNADSLSNDEVAKKCADVIALFEQKKKLQENISSDTSELERFTYWGELNPDDFVYLREKGIALKMFEIPEDKYNLIEDGIKTICVNRFKKTVRFLALDDGAERPAGLPPEAFEVSMPASSTVAISERISNDSQEIAKIESELAASAVYIKQIEAFKKNLESDILFENVYSGMGQEKDGKETDLAWLSGFVPVDELDELKSVAAKNAWALAYSDPADDDEVPTKLKNNAFVSLIYPLTDFLGTVPGYRYFRLVPAVFYSFLRNDFRRRRIRTACYGGGIYNACKGRGKQKARFSGCRIDAFTRSCNCCMGTCYLHMVRTYAGPVTEMADVDEYSANFECLCRYCMASVLGGRYIEGNAYKCAKYADFLFYACVRAAFRCALQRHEQIHKIAQVFWRIWCAHAAVGNVLRGFVDGR